MTKMIYHNQTKLKPRLTDVQFCEAALYWPRFPLLPMIRRADNEHGVIHWSDPTTVVIEFNIWHPPEGNFESWRQQTAGLETRTYPSIAALLKEWRID